MHSIDPPPSPSAVTIRLRGRARTTGLALAVGATVLFPLWSLFDAALEPAPVADTFLTLRVVGTVVMAALTGLLWATRWGRNRPAFLAAAVLAVVQVGVGWMLPQVNHLELYLLGATLALLACGAVLSASPWWSVLLCAATASGIALGMLTTGRTLDIPGLTAAACYLGSASVVAVIGHWLRWSAQRSEVRWRCALEAEQVITHRLIDELRRLSIEDSLTGLANRRAWDDHLTSACTDAKDDQTTLAVAIIDIDHFKTINDTRGHAAGDTVLHDVASILRDTVRETDIAARLGGDELALLLPRTGPVQAALIAERVRAEVARLPVPPGTPPVTVSIGVAVGAGAGARPDDLLRVADTHLYMAKTTRNRVTVDGTAPAQPDRPSEPEGANSDDSPADEPSGWLLASADT